MSDVPGLDRNMHEAYHLLLREPACSAAHVAQRLGLSRANADRILARLVAIGLVGHSSDNPEQLVPIDPRRRLGPLVARWQARLVAQQDDLARSREALAALAAAYTAHGRAAPAARPGRSPTVVRLNVDDRSDTRSPACPSPQERDLLRLLSRGRTDASAARQLGVSLRTVRRMMAELMDRLDARSRFEAGIRAAEKGWVDSGTSTPFHRTVGDRTISRRPPTPGATAAFNG